MKQPPRVIQEGRGSPSRLSPPAILPPGTSRACRPAARPGSPAIPIAILLALTGALAPVLSCRSSRSDLAVEGDAAISGATLHFEIRGAGRPVVLIHGGQMDRRMWDDQFETFAREYRVLRYDARGYGSSGPVDSTYAAHEDLRGLLRFLNIGTVRLVGLSLGGRVALDFALVYPDMVEALVLAGPGVSGWKWQAADNDFLLPILAAARAGDGLLAARLWLESPYMSPAMELPEVADRLRRIAEENSGVWMGADLETELAPPAIDRLAEIRAPTLLILGTRDVPDIHRIVSALETGIAGARRVTLEGAGHMTNMERPDAFNRAVLDFLRQVEGKSEATGRS